MSHHHQHERERDEGWAMEEMGPYAGVGPKGYQRSDERIYEDVCDRLTLHGRIDARNIRVQVEDGEVTLAGFVRDRHTRRMAEDLAGNVGGVKDVHNELSIGQKNRQAAGWHESGMPGGGQGRVDQVGESGVYPASGPLPEENAPVHGQASWGQGERGAAGYEDSGESELHIPAENKEKENH